MLLATTQVEDFDRFLEIFSTTGAEKRKQHGSKGALVFRDPSEDDRVWVALRLGRAGLAELRVRPRGPGDHEGGRAQGQAAGRGSSPAATTPDVQRRARGSRTQRPNQRARRDAPNSAFSAANASEGSLRAATGDGPPRKLTSTLLTSPAPNSA